MVRGAATVRGRLFQPMCGIAGLILSTGAPPPDPATLSRLIDSLHHRGPDGTGHAVVGRVALVHNRLSIIDLVTGDQPLFAGPATLVCNGEIYNYRELRAAMPGVSFATNSDCEPPLHLWLREGADYAQHLRGMYAIAIHERVQRTVTLTRDPFGIKPLYIAQVGDGLAFASEPQALLEAGLVPRTVRAGGARGTAATAVHHRRRDDLRGHPAPAAGRDADLRRRPHPGSPPRLAHSRGRARRTSTRTRRWCGSIARWRKASICTSAADVPYGMFLSGGIDSATLLTLMARLNSQPVLAFTAGFDAPGAADEREHAATVAKALGAKHESIEINETDGLAASAGDRRLHGRSRGRLRDHPDLVPGPARAAGREGRAERRGRRRDLRRLRPLSQCHAAVVARRPGDVGARQLRPRGRAAVAPVGLARRHRRGGGARPRTAAAPGWPRRRPPTWPTGCRTICC